MEPSDSKSRVFSAADELFEELGGNDIFPSVDAVRRAAKVNMNDASFYLREWKKSKISHDIKIIKDLPSTVQDMALRYTSLIWQEAQKVSSETIRITNLERETEREDNEKLRLEMAEAFESCSNSLEAASSNVSNLENTVLEKEKTINGLISKLAATESKLEEALNRTNIANSERDEAKSDADRAEGEVAALRKYLDELLNRLPSLK